MINKNVYHNKLKKVYKIIYHEDDIVHLDNGQVIILYVPIKDVILSSFNIEDINGIKPNVGDVIQFNCGGIKYTHKLLHNDDLFEDALFTLNSFYRFDNGFVVI